MLLAGRQACLLLRRGQGDVISKADSSCIPRRHRVVHQHLDRGSLRGWQVALSRAVLHICHSALQCTEQMLPGFIHDLADRAGVLDGDQERVSARSLPVLRQGVLGIIAVHEAFLYAGDFAVHDDSPARRPASVHLAEGDQMRSVVHAYSRGRIVSGKSYAVREAHDKQAVRIGDACLLHPFLCDDELLFPLCRHCAVFSHLENVSGSIYLVVLAPFPAIKLVALACRGLQGLLGVLKHRNHLVSSLTVIVNIGQLHEVRYVGEILVKGPRLRLRAEAVGVRRNVLKRRLSEEGGLDDDLSSAIRCIPGRGVDAVFKYCLPVRIHADAHAV